MFLNVFNLFSIRTFFQGTCFVGILGSIVLINACSSNTSQSKTPSQPTPTQTLNTRVTNLENQSRLFREIQEELNGIKSNILELKRMRKEVQELEQLERNQNKLFLEYQEKFEERIAQIERNLDRNTLKFRGLTGEPSQSQEDTENDLEQSLSGSASGEQTQGIQTSKTGSTLTSPVPQKSVPTPMGVEQLFESGLALHSAKQYLKAIQIFQQLRKEHPDHPNAIEGHYLIGDAYFSLQDYQNAAIAFYEFTEQYPQYPNNFDAKWKLAQSLEKSGEIGLALDIYQEMVSQENSPYREQAQEKLKTYEKQSQ